MKGGGGGAEVQNYSVAPKNPIPYNTSNIAIANWLKNAMGHSRIFKHILKMGHKVFLGVLK